MAVLNITFRGLCADFPLDMMVELTDWDVRRIAVELLRGARAGLEAAELCAASFENYVVDRFTSPAGERRIYLRPKVPFAGPRSA